MKYWLLFTSHVVPVVVVVIGAFLLFTQVRSCRDDKQSNAGAVMSERVRVDTVTDKRDSAALAETQRQLNLALVNNAALASLRQRFSAQPIPTGTPHDSITHLTQQVRSCRDAGDSLLQSVVKIQSACTAFRDTATKRIADLQLARSHLDSLLKIGKPSKHWGLGLFVGYGLHSDSAWAIKRGAVAGIGLSYNVFQW